MGMNIEENQKLVEEILEAYPKKRRGRTARSIFRWRMKRPLIAAPVR
ncbi:hypothetical protein ACFSQ7_10685 [Paenibacillus rhizoplanae]